MPVSIIAGARRRRGGCAAAEPGSARATSFWPAALFGAALLPQALQRPDTAHLSWVTGVTFALSIPALADLLGATRTGGRLGRTGAEWTGIGVVAAVLVLVIPFYPVRTYADLVGQTFGFNRFGFEVTNDGRRFYFGSEDGAADAQAVVDELAARSEPGQSLIVGPTDLSRTNYSDAFFYHLFPELDARHPLHRDGPRHRRRGGVRAGRGAGAQRLADPVRRAGAAGTSPTTAPSGGPRTANQVVRDRYCTVRRHRHVPAAAALPLTLRGPRGTAPA